MNSTYIKNYGIAETYINNKKSSLEWEGEYDGNIGKIKVENNGKKENIEFDNEDLLKLLNHREVNEPIDQRLIRDFLSPTKKTKSKRKKTKSSRKNKYKKYIK
jgi:hypothetical protein